MSAGAPAHVLLLGKGTVGSAVLDQLAALGGQALRVFGVADSRRALTPVDLSRWRAQLEGAPEQAAVELLAPLAELPRPVLIDCTAAAGMEALYLAAFRLGIAVVSANKKPLVIPWAERERLFAAAGLASYRYETTVGAGLPVLEPLKDLLRTADELRQIEGSFSGTLGYLCGELSRGVPLSRAVRGARELGYTEPHPAEDLSGADVGRKALILAREAGLSLELADVQVEPFVPAHLLAEPDPDRFIERLETLDASLGERIRTQAKEGLVLRYLARIDVEGRTAQVAPRWVEVAHPAAALKGTEALVTYSSRRYRDLPLRVQGPGAGAEVTAAGVVADALKAAGDSREAAVPRGNGRHLHTA